MSSEPSGKVIAPRGATRAIKRRLALALAFNACFFAALFWWLQHNVNLADLQTQITHLPLSPLIVAMALNVTVLTLYGLRVATILKAPWPPCFLLTTIGFTFNSLLPFRIGEGVKIYVGGSFFNMPVGSLSATIVMEKLYDLSAIVAMAAVIGLTTPSPFVSQGRATLLALAGALVACALLIARYRSRGVALLPEATVRRAPRLAAFVRQAESLLMTHHVAKAALLTALIWTINASLAFWLFSALLPEIDFGVIGALSILVIGALAIAFPASPAGLGLFEAGVVSYLHTLHGVPHERAIPAALAYHFCLTAPHTVIVILYFGALLLRAVKANLSI